MGDFLDDDAAIKSHLSALFEGNLSCNGGVKRMILADTNILAGHDLGTALAHDNHTRAGCLAVSEFNPEVFRV